MPSLPKAEQALFSHLLLMNQVADSNRLYSLTAFQIKGITLNTACSFTVMQIHSDKIMLWPMSVTVSFVPL